MGDWHKMDIERIMALLRRTLFVKLLGSYPAATVPIVEDATPELDETI